VLRQSHQTPASIRGIKVTGHGAQMQPFRQPRDDVLGGALPIGGRIGSISAIHTGGARNIDAVYGQNA